MTDARVPPVVSRDGPPEAVLAAAFPDRSIEVRERFRSRETNAVCEVRAGDSEELLVLKCTSAGRWRLRKEAAVLRSLADVPGVPVPAVRSVGTAGGDEWAYLVTSKCSGRPARERLRAAPDRTADTLRTIGRTIARLHDDVTVSRSGSVVWGDDGSTFELAESPNTWHGVLAEKLQAEAAILEDTPFEDAADRALATLNAHRDFVTDVPEPALLHCDVNLGNVFFDGASVSCLVDWEYAKAGDPGYEVVAAEHRIVDHGPVDAAHRGALAEGYRNVRPLPDAFERRRRLYRALLPIDRMVYLCGGSEAADPSTELSDAAVTSLREVAQRRHSEFTG